MRWPTSQRTSRVDAVTYSQQFDANLTNGEAQARATLALELERDGVSLDRAITAGDERVRNAFLSIEGTP